MSEAVAVLGAGSWGTALAIQLARSNPEIRLWGHNPAHVQRLAELRENTDYLPGFELASNITPMASLQTAIAGCHFLLIAIPSKGFRGLLQDLKPLLETDQALFWASKGFEIDTGLLLHEVIEQELPGCRYGVISGPTFASEVARGLPAAIACAGNDEAITEAFAECLRGRRCCRRARLWRQYPGRVDDARTRRDHASQHSSWRPTGNHDGVGGAGRHHSHLHR